MTRDRLISTIVNIEYSKLLPADRRVLNDFLNNKKAEIAGKYVELTKRMQKPGERDDKS